MNSSISVVICTYNREDLIVGCLDSLKNQSADYSMFEVLVIDNNSTDKTYKLVENFAHLPNLRLVLERNQGLSNTRNRGIKEARFEYIAFLDDDARAHPDYIKNARRLILHPDRLIDCLGGPILPFYTTPKPDWFKDKYETRRLGAREEFLIIGQSFSGSNMIWRRNLLNELGGFDPDFEVTGNNLILGEETALFDQLWKTRKPVLLFSPNLLVFHWVSPDKFNIKYRIKRALAIGQALEPLEIDQKTKFEKMIYFFLLLRNVVVVSARALINIFRHRNIRNWIEEEVTSLIILLGKFIALLGVHPVLAQRLN